MSLRARRRLTTLTATAALAAGSAAALGSPSVAAPDDGGGGSGLNMWQSATTQIVNGTASSTSKYPWQVRLEVGTNQGTGLCGGAIIHSRIVLTAAHCLEGATGAVAYLGKDMAASGGIPMNAVGSYLPPSYNPGTSENDYGLLFFGSAIPAAYPPIKIAGPSETSLWRAGRAATIAGFGNVTEGGQTSPTLLEVTVPIQADATCGAASSYGSRFRPSNMLCAGGMAGGFSTCQGDSGGPLVVPADGGTWRIAGLVSWANGCARPNFPTVYTRIADPAMSARLADEIVTIRNANPAIFPGIESTLDFIGGGAVPLGCTAAQAASNGAAGANASAAATLSSASAGARNAAAKAKKANKRVKKAKKALAKSRSRGARAAAARALTKATKKLKKAKKALKSAKSRLTGAQQSAAAAQASAAAAAATATATCT